MKTILTLLSFIVFSMQLNAQFTLSLKGKDPKSGQTLELKEISTKEGFGQALILKGGELKSVGLNEIKKIDYEINNLKDFWQNQAVKNEVYENLLKYGFQYDLRRDWEEEALKYLNELEQNNLTFEDSYLENYLYSLTYKLYPGSINDGRPGILNVKLMIANAPNAFIFPNGTMILTTGLLSTINSEEELIAIMAHEVSHFVLDHSTININKAIQRQKNAEFWAAFVTGLAAATELYASSKNEHYFPGALTYSTAILSFNLASAFTERLGLKYSRDQEIAADKCAVELLKYLKIDPTALSSALAKIKDYCIVTGNYYALTGNGSHPNISERISLIGKPNSFTSSKYDKLISFVNTTNAINEFNNKHFNACQNLVNRNINAGVPTEDDYVLKAMTNLYLYDNLEKNLESLELINKAKNLNVAPMINIHKQEALVLIRLNKNTEALIALKTYSDKLDQALNDIESIKNENSWFLTKQYLEDEKTWTSKMIYKVKTM